MGRGRGRVGGEGRLHPGESGLRTCLLQIGAPRVSRAQWSRMAPQIIHFAPPSYWSQLAVLTPPSGHSSPVATLAWAPSCGRSYHLIASGARDGVVRIHKLVPPAEGTAGREWQTSLVAEITDHVEGSGGGGGGVGRVEWNVTGTVLSTAGCDGRVRLWKAGYSGEWRVMSTISCEGKSGDGSQPQSHHQRR